MTLGVRGAAVRAHALNAHAECLVTRTVVATLVLLARLLAGVLARLARRRRLPAVHVREPPDRRALRVLRDAGADLARATEVRFFLYFPSRGAAERAAALVGVVRVDSPRLGVTVRRAAAGDAWLCLVVVDIVPAEGAIVDASAQLGAIAASHGGALDGWEAAVAW